VSCMLFHCVSDEFVDNISHIARTHLVTTRTTSKWIRTASPSNAKPPPLPLTRPVPQKPMCFPGSVNHSLPPTTDLLARSWRTPKMDVTTWALWVHMVLHTYSGLCSEDGGSSMAGRGSRDRVFMSQLCTLDARRIRSYISYT
jgi:hypothetical protein